MAQGEKTDVSKRSNEVEIGWSEKRHVVCLIPEKSVLSPLSDKALYL